MNKSKEIIGRLQDAGIRYWAGDNISDVLQEGDKEQLIKEATIKALKQNKKKLLL